MKHNNGLQWIGLGILAAVLTGCVSAGPEPIAKPDMQRAAKINVQLGVDYMRQGKRDLAMQKLQKALEQNPDSAEAHNAVALLYWQTGDIDKADENFQEALDLNDSDPMVANNYGTFLCQQDRPKESIEYFMAAAQDPNYPQPEGAWSNAGVCAHKASDLSDAEKYLRKALAINPQYASALAELASVSLDEKKYLQARAFLQRLSTQGALDAGGLLLGYKIEKALGNEADAKDYAAKLREKYPSSSEASQLNGNSGS